MERDGLLHFETSVLDPSAQWIVFIHGAGGNMVSWKYQTQIFSEYFNLLLLDLRDHGESKQVEPQADSYDLEIIIDDILRVIKYLGIEKAHFMSLSLGSVILQGIYERKPELVDRMVMAGGIFQASKRLKLFVASANLLKRVLGFRIIYQIFSWIVLPRKTHANSRKVFRRQSRKLNSREFLRWVTIRKDFLQKLRKYFDQELKRMTLVVMGSEDYLFLKHAKRFTEKQALASLVVIQHSGHIVNIEHRKTFNEIALKFLLDTQKTIEQMPVSSS